MALCPAVEALFTRGTNATSEGLADIKQSSTYTRLQCVALGHELSEAAFKVMTTQYTEAKILDLSDQLFSDASDSGLLEIVKIFPGVKALFTTAQIPQQLTDGGFDQLQQECSSLVCLLLGREIKRDVYPKLMQMCAKTSVDLCDSEYVNVTADGLKEVPQLCKSLEALFTRPGQFAQQALQQVKVECNATGKCIRLGCEVAASTYQEMKQQLADSRMLDLSDQRFYGLSDRGFAELVSIPGLTANLEAIFTGSSNISKGALRELKKQCPGARCVLLGRSINMQTWETLFEACQRPKPDFNLAVLAMLASLERDRYGLQEFADMCSGLEHGEEALQQAWRTSRSSYTVSSFLHRYITTKLQTLTGERSVPEEKRLKLPITAGKNMTESEQEDAEFKARQLKMVLDAKFFREKETSETPVLFNLEEILGAGGSGLVVKAQANGLKGIESRGQVAIKVVTPQLNPLKFVEKEKRRLEREMEAMKAVRHPSVCVCHDSFFDADDRMCIMVLEYLNGEDLDDLIQSQTEPLLEVQVVRIVHECLEGLMSVHSQQLVHRDIKPGNIMRHTTPGGDTVFKIIDFGLAMASSEEEGMTLNSVMKTGGL